MLQNIRNNVQGAMAKGIIILITIPFVLTGAETLLSSSGSSKVAKVNGTEISQQQLEEEVYLLKRRMMSQADGELDSAMLDDKRLKTPALNSLIERTLLEQEAKQQGMLVPEAEINRMIMQTEEFQEEGRFSKDRYAALLSASGLTPGLYKRLYRNDVLRGQYISGITATDFLTKQELQAHAEMLYQQRDIKYLRLSSEALQSSVQPSSEEVEQFYQENPQLFIQPEQVVLNYIELKQSDFETEPSEQELKTAYQQELENFSAGGEQRQVSHIMLDAEASNVDEQIAEIQQKLAEGESFAQLAEQYSTDIGSQSQGGFLGELQKDFYPKEFLAAAEKLGEGEVSEPVTTADGIHIIRVDQLVKQEIESYEERKESLAKELKEAKASPLFWAAVEQLKDSSFNAPDLELPASELGIKVQQSGPVTRSGGEGLFAKRSLVEIAFSDDVLKQGYNSEVIEVDADTVVVMHLHKYQEETVLPFAEVQQQAEQALKQQQIAQQLEQQLEQLEKALLAGEKIEDLANKYQLEWQIMAKATRESATGSAAEIVNFAFSLPSVKQNRTLIESHTLSNGDMALLVISNTKPGKADALAESEQQLVAQYMGQASGSLSFELLQQQLQNQAKIKRY